MAQDDLTLEDKSSSDETQKKNTTQYSTFFISGRLYGIDVMKVQEVLKTQPMSEVPLAPKFVHGLINLRGQIATAIGLRELFGIESNTNEEKMNVVCQTGDSLLSLLVDRIGDVMEVTQDDFELPPETIPEEVRRFMKGVYKVKNDLLSIIEVDKVQNILKAA